MSNGRQRVILALVALFATTPAAMAQVGKGLQVARKDVLSGNPHQTAAPAEIDLARCIGATPEGQTIESERVERGSARYSILMTKAHERVVRAVAHVAAQKSRDCVVKKGSYRNPEGLTVLDISDEVIAAIGNDRDS